MSEPRIRVLLTRREIGGVLTKMPPCCECRMRAEGEIDGRPMCVPCASHHRTGKWTSPAWADAADAMECALSPHDPVSRS